MEKKELVSRIRAAALDHFTKYPEQFLSDEHNFPDEDAIVNAICWTTTYWESRGIEEIQDSIEYGIDQHICTSLIVRELEVYVIGASLHPVYN